MLEELTEPTVGEYNSTCVLNTHSIDTDSVFSSVWCLAALGT
jgi:hypothetical protein